jgi:hypothetical protein
LGDCPPPVAARSGMPHTEYSHGGTSHGRNPLRIPHAVPTCSCQSHKNLLRSQSRCEVRRSLRRRQAAKHKSEPRGRHVHIFYPRLVRAPSPFMIDRPQPFKPHPRMRNPRPSPPPLCSFASMMGVGGVFRPTVLPSKLTPCRQTRRLTSSWCGGASPPARRGSGWRW